MKGMTPVSYYSTGHLNGDKWMFWEIFLILWRDLSVNPVFLQLPSGSWIFYKYHKLSKLSQ